VPSSTSVTPDVPLTPRDSVAGEPRDSAHRHFSIADFIERYTGVVILVVLAVAWVITLPDTFPTLANLRSVANNQAITFIMCMGVVMVLSAGVFDISIAGMMTLSVVFTTNVFQGTQGKFPVVLVILLALVIGVLGGLLNGVLVVRLSVDPLIATLGTSSVFLGLASLVGGGRVASSDIPPAFLDLGQSQPFGIPLPIFYAAVVALVLWYVLSMTPLGRMIYATGQGREAAALSGVPTKAILYLVFVISAAAAALAGLVYSARIGSGTPDVGNAYLLPVYAACFLGSTIIRPGRFNVPGTLVATLILAVGINGLQLHGVQNWVNNLFQGGALIIAVVIGRLRSQRR
jgi:ribose transport system permease protein